MFFHTFFRKKVYKCDEMITFVAEFSDNFP